MIDVIKSQNDATVLRNTLLSSVTKEFHDKEALVKIINIHVFRSFEDDLFAMPVRP